MDDIMHVGEVKGTDDIFIAVGDGQYEKCMTPITKSVRHVVTMSVGDAEWMADALMQEVRRVHGRKESLDGTQA